MKPSLIPRLQQSRHQVGHAELNFLLDTNQQAAILIDARTQMIIASNAKAVELTAYTRNELEMLGLFDVFLEISLDEVMAMRNNFLETTLIAHKSHHIPVIVYPYILDIKQWVLLTIEPLAKREQHIAERIRSDNQQSGAP